MSDVDAHTAAAARERGVANLAPRAPLATLAPPDGTRAHNVGVRRGDVVVGHTARRSSNALCAQDRTTSHRMGAASAARNRRAPPQPITLDSPGGACLPHVRRTASRSTESFRVRGTPYASAGSERHRFERWSQGQQTLGGPAIVVCDVATRHQRDNARGDCLRIHRQYSIGQRDAGRRSRVPAKSGRASGRRPTTLQHERRTRMAAVRCFPTQRRGLR